MGSTGLDGKVVFGVVGGSVDVVRLFSSLSCAVAQLSSFVAVVVVVVGSNCIEAGRVMLVCGRGLDDFEVSMARL